jgi:hypothetical protein
MGLFNSQNTDRRPTYYFNHISGLPGMSQWQQLKVVFDMYNKELVITGKGSSSVSRLKLKQVVSCGVVKSQDIQNAGNRSLGMAVAGGLLFGDTGAIVGSIIGSTKSKAKKNVDCFILNYEPQSAPGTANTIVFEVPEGSLAGSYLWENLRPYCKSKPITTTSNSYL